MATYHDYAWIQQYLNTSLSLGYCAALIPGSTPAQVLSAVGADENTPSEAIGIAELSEAMSDLTEQPETAGAGQVVALAAVGDDSTLLMQLNGGSFTITEDLMGPLLSDREVASHYLSVNADSQFIWWSNGTRVAEFELFGSGPVVGDDRVVDLILDVGGIGIDDDAHGYPGEHAVEGAFALAEQITGVAVFPSLFEAGHFTVAVVPEGGQSPPAVLPPKPSTQTSPSSWSEVARRYKAAERVPLHGFMSKDRPRGGRPSARLEFWFKPRTCIRLSDEQGALFLQNRQKQKWFRNEGVLERRTGGYSLDIHIEQLLQIHRTWPDTRFADLLPPDTTGQEVAVDGRPAWEFEMPPDWAGRDSTVAFDAETGVPLRWETRTGTHEISALETDIDVGDDFFTGP
ncbi:hypothetical protein BKP42_67620 [Rhodococcus erythropolis]|uniref:DUF6461 domain-containing protein n=1 Tax=Rhodococcus erythropolis TaxID=1833 RepID=UPI000BB2ED76|nr:DUF6461 domain-containing protein [Rhodococcus erythropolis]PBI83775.1 hypothetical protein BKP42_67620 [Rhodococcus erythropolis]